MEYVWSDDVASVHEIWDDNRIPYLTLFHLIPPCLHTVPHYTLSSKTDSFIS
jgi:hypothetical protein